MIIPQPHQKRSDERPINRTAHKGFNLELRNSGRETRVRFPPSACVLEAYRMSLYSLLQISVTQNVTFFWMRHPQVGLPLDGGRGR